jgi:hypothetical protein
MSRAERVVIVPPTDVDLVVRVILAVAALIKATALLIRACKQPNTKPRKRPPHRLRGISPV